MPAFCLQPFASTLMKKEGEGEEDSDDEDEAAAAPKQPPPKATPLNAFMCVGASL